MPAPTVMKSSGPFFPPRWLAAVPALALTLVLFQAAACRADGPPATEQAAPAWKLRDLDGREVSSEQFEGKVLVVDFWATWCGPCISEIPGYVALQKKYGPEGLAIVGISVDQKAAAEVKKFAEAKGINYTIVMADGDVTGAFGGVEVIPTTFLIGRNGKIVHQKKGAMAHEAYEKLVVQALQTPAA